MKLFFLAKRSSLRTKFIVFTLSLFAIANLFLVIYYPVSVYNEELKRLKDWYEKEILYLSNRSQDINLADGEEYINSMLSRLEELANVEYLATHYLGAYYTKSSEQFSKGQIDSLQLNEIHFVNGKNVLALLIPVQDKTRIGVIDLKVGISADQVLSAESFARFQSFILILISALMIYLFAFFFDKIIYTPLKKISNLSLLISAGQENVEEKRDFSLEFNQIINNFDAIAKQISELRTDNKLIPQNIKKSQKKAEEIQKNLDKEIELMSNLVVYILDLRKEKSENGIFNNLLKEVTTRLGYSLAILFQFDNNKLTYRDSTFKGFSVLNEKLKTDLKDFIISDQNTILKEMQNNNPLIKKELPFSKIMTRYNLSGQYALIPISTMENFYGMLVVGNIGEDVKMDHKDLEKLMLIANTVALHIENINNISNLKRSFNQRTSELETTNRLLSDSILEKDNMLKLVSHDLNAPLRNIIGLIESIERKYQDSMEKDLSERIVRIRKNIEKELNTIDEILTNFKSTENIDLTQSVDVESMIESILDELSFELRNKNIKIVLDRNLPVFISNYAIMKHIFLNLIDNACKYMPLKKRGNKIQISFKENDQFSTFSVEDNGSGIPDEKQKYIFDSFNRINPDNGSGLGKGLGLALVKNMVGKLGGEINFTSKENKGTSFYIRIEKNNLD